MWNYTDIKQEHDSALTSINGHQMPSTIKLVEGIIVSGQKWLDLGGGKFENAVDFFKTKNAQLMVYDPFNRTKEHNAQVVESIAKEPCDGVMVNNVLNVIAEKNNRQQVIKQAFTALKENAYAFFLIYEGSANGHSRVTKQTKDSSCFQMNQKSSFYIDEVKEIFGENVQRKGSFLIAKKSLVLDNIPQLKSDAKKLGLSRYGEVGKSIGGSMYVHKDYVDVFPQDVYQKALDNLRKNTVNFDFTIIKYHKENQSFSFIASPDFDKNDEPMVGNAILVTVDGNLKFTSQKKDPQIYHHKWLFVKDDYKGFEVEKSLERTLLWKNKMGINKEISSRIGTQGFWKEWLKDVGLDGKATKFKS